MEDSMRRILLAGLFTILISISLLAHHASTWADMQHPRTLTGKVVEWNYINPHVTMVLAVKEENGATENWTIEFSSPQSLGRSGWSISTVKAGDEVTLT